jgi:hypothetical protein
MTLLSRLPRKRYGGRGASGARCTAPCSSPIGAGGQRRDVVELDRIEDLRSSVAWGYINLNNYLPIAYEHRLRRLGLFQRRRVTLVLDSEVLIVFREYY